MNKPMGQSKDSVAEKWNGQRKRQTQVRENWNTEPQALTSQWGLPLSHYILTDSKEVWDAVIWRKAERTANAKALS